MWAAAQGHARDDRDADRGGRRRQRALDRRRVGAPADEEPRDKWLPPGGLTPLLLRGARGLRRRARRRSSTARPTSTIVDPDRHSALVLALINGHFDVAGAAHRARHRREPEGQGRPDRAVGGGGRAHDAVVEPPGAARDRRRAVEPGRHQDAAGARRRGGRRRCARRFPIAPSSIAAATACSAPARRRCCARPRPATCRSSSCCSRRARTPRRPPATASTRVMMAANVAAREEDMTGRNKTQREAIETIQLLLAAGADVNAADTQGRTAAHGAALWGLTDVVRFLHKNGATVRRQGQARVHAARHRAGPGRRLRLRRHVGCRPGRNRQGDPGADRAEAQSASGPGLRPGVWPWRPQSRRRQSVGGLSVELVRTVDGGWYRLSMEVGVDCRWRLVVEPS